MTSKRELIVEFIKTALANTEGVSGRVFRGRPTPARAEEMPCIFVSWVNDLPAEANVASFDWVLQVRVTIITNDDEADVVADPIISSVHSILMADRTLGDLAIDLSPGEQRMDIIDADKPVGMLQAFYNVNYRTNQEDLT